MICDTPEAFAALLPFGRAVAGLDLGTVTIGVAVSDGYRSVASPLETVKRTKFTADAARLIHIADGRNLAGFVLGLPLNMDGSESPRSQSSRSFAGNIKNLGLPILLWDERWSTVAAERFMIEADLSRAKRAERIDSAAAAHILQGAIDALVV